MGKFVSVKTFLLFLLSCLVLFCVQGQEKKKINAVFEKEYASPLKIAEYVSSMDMNNAFIKEVNLLPTQNIRVEMVVSGKEKGLLAGAKVKIFSGKKNSILVPIFWNKKVTEEKTLYTGEFTANAKGITRILFLPYKCKGKGTLLVHRIKMSISDDPVVQKAAAPATPAKVQKTPPPEEKEKTHLTATFEKTFEEPLKVNKYVWAYDVGGNFASTIRKLKNQLLTVEMVVSGEDKNTLAGAKVKLFSKRKGGTFLAPIFWKKKVTKEKTLYKGVCDAKVIDASRVQFLVYNCTVKGTLLVHSIKMTVAGECYTKAELKKKSAGKKIDPKGKIPLTPLTVKRDFFPAGVYFYVTEKFLGKTPAEAEKKFRACMKDIASHHCNTVYISGLSSEPEVLNKYCKIASEYGIKVFAQGNGSLYVQIGKGPDYFENVTMRSFRKNLPLIKADNLMGFSTKEEVDPEPYAIDLMQKARASQKQLLKKVPTYTLHNRLNAMAMDDDPANQPDWYAFDMYRFKLHPSRNVVMTPSKAAYRIRTNLEIAYLHAAKYGKPLIFTGQGVKVFSTVKSNKFTKASAMKEISPGVWQGYTRYMPKNAMYLQFYLSVMSGCRGFLVYHYMSADKEQTLVKKDLTPQFYWTEMGECLSEAKALFPLFASWYKQDVRKDLKTSSKTVWVREFKLPDMPGSFYLPVNTLLAKWDKNNPILTNVNTQLYSDKDNLQGFEWASAQTFSLALPGKEPLYDLLTGKVVDKNKITLEPGRGRVFYQGKKNDLDSIRKRFSLK